MVGPEKQVLMRLRDRIPVQESVIIRMGGERVLTNIE
jgi:hypothetical protein